LVSINAVTALKFLVVDLGLGVTLRADSSDQVESWKASAGPDGGVPDLIGLASSATDAVSGIIGLGGWADSAAVPDEVVSGLALADAIDPLLIGVAGSDAESQVGDVSAIADALLGDWTVGRVEGAGGARSIGQLEVLRQAHASLGSDVVDPLSIAGDSANTETLIIDLVPFALAADSVDGVVSGDAAALSVGEDLIDSASNHTETALISVS
jgi:hypothetical protein